MGKNLFAAQEFPLTVVQCRVDDTAGQSETQSELADPVEQLCHLGRRRKLGTCITISSFGF